MFPPSHVHFFRSPLPPRGKDPCALAENVFTAPTLSREGDQMTLGHKPALLAFTGCHFCDLRLRRLIAIQRLLLAQSRPFLLFRAAR